MEITEVLTHLAETMKMRGDEHHARMIGELLDKWHSGKASIGLTGHFSAGKSSLINALCGRALLPTGPIPTSANLVVIEDGQEEAVVVRGGISGEEAIERIALEHLADYCKDGETFRRIDIRYPSKLLGSALRLLDTPGVDSTDDGHHQATHAALHLADAVLFVTDYNHVLSETNMAFLQRLHEDGKLLYLVVNQVDKHRERELPWDTYRSNIHQTLEDWSVRPQGILFVSVKKPGHPLSEWNRLLWTIEQLKERARDLLAHNIVHSARVLIKAHAASLRAGIGPLEEERLAEAEQSLEQLRLKAQSVEAEMTRARHAFNSELAKVLDNAQLMPADARELAARYLQSRKPGFKAGWLAGEAKTKAEIRSRLSAFSSRLTELVEERLVRHIRKLLEDFAGEYGGDALDGGEGIRLEAELSADWLAGEVNEAAVMNDAYYMTYCTFIADRIRSAYRKKASEIMEPVLAGLEQKDREKLEQCQEQIRTLETETEQLRTTDRKLRELSQLEAGLMERLRGASAPLDNMAWPDPARLAEPAAGQQACADPASAIGGEISAGELVTDAAMEENAASPSVPAFHYRDAMEQTARDLEQFAERIADASSLASLRRDLLQRADKLRSARFTIALFGAFSAGKSSLANALIGEPALPVSPNPTTAAINSVLPPDGEHPHGTAVIRMKSPEALLDDIRFSLSMLGGDPDGMDSPEKLDAVLGKLQAGQLSAKAKTHISFLQAVSRGYPDVRDLLGTQWKADYDTYARFVAEESKSCFVESIDLHYRTRFGEQGVVFVDTPGADSIHARHTGVTFNYMKNADAILFVTYYNHAFSQADKQFLLQLGRVKQSFELDKMFFIVNAADLADSEEELQIVLDYVQQQLLLHGIREPRLFPVSSRRALEARTEGNSARLEESGLPRFERSFADFAERELADAAIRAARAELEHAEARFRSWQEAMRQDEEARNRKAEQLRSTASWIAADLGAADSIPGSRRIGLELGELLHHVKQRVYYRFGELYNDAFHPSVLQDDGRPASSMLLAAWRQLVQSVSVELSHEMLATTLRMERYARKLMQDWLRQAMQAISDRLTDVPVQEPQLPVHGTPDVSEKMAVQDPDTRMLARTYRNAKHFFEGEGKAALRQQLEPHVMNAVAAYIEQHEQVFLEHCEQWVRASIRSAAAAWAEQLEEEAEGLAGINCYSR